jgi:hypothetical protein
MTPILEPLSGQEYEPEKRVKILGSLCIILGFVFQLISSGIDIGVGY